MRKIFSSYNRPVCPELSPIGDSDTVQGLVTSLSAILMGGDDNNMQTMEMGYSGDEVVDLYPEVFGRPTKYEMDYYNQSHEPGGPSDTPSEQPKQTPPADVPADTTTENIVE